MEFLCPVCGVPMETAELDEGGDTMTLRPCGHEVEEILPVA